MTLHTIPDIEICTSGMDWPASSGPTTITSEHIADAVAAANDDPHIQVPRGRLGHDSSLNDGAPRFDPFALIGDAEPAFGRFVNLRTTNDGAVLVGDAVDVPDWITPGTFPNRSMECDWDIVTPGGKRYSMVVTAVSWLGVYFPAVQDLEDLTTLIAGGPDALAASRQEGTVSDTPTAASTGTATPTAASVSTSVIRQRFNYDWAMADPPPVEGLDTYWWWARDLRIDPNEIIADDDEGNLWAVPYSTDGVDEVTFGEPVRVLETYVPAPSAAAALTATAPESQRVLAAFTRPAKQERPTTAASRPDTSNERNPMDESVRKALAAAHGLDPDTASEADVNAAVLAAAQTPVEPVAETPEPEVPVAPVEPAAVVEPEASTETPAPAAEPDASEATVTPITPAPADTVTEPTHEPVPVAASVQGPKTVAVTQEVWDKTQADLAALTADRTQREQAATIARRNDKADNWVRTGRITPHERALARTNLDINEEATTKAYDALAPGKVPVQLKAVDTTAAKTEEDALYEASRRRMGADPTPTAQEA